MLNWHPLSKKVKGETNVSAKTKDWWVNDEREWVLQRNVHPAMISRKSFAKVKVEICLSKRALVKWLDAKFDRESYEDGYILVTRVHSGRKWYQVVLQNGDRKKTVACVRSSLYV